MKRILLIIALLSVIVLPVSAKKQKITEVSDREYWADLAYKISLPVLKNMGNGELVKNMPVEFSPTFDNRNKSVAYMEAFGRLMSGIAPWLALPDDETEEGLKRKELREYALKAYVHAVDPDSPDYLKWDKEGQALVDAAYIASSFLRAKEALWEPLDDVTKERYIEKFQSLRWVDTPYTNWILFSAMTETFLLTVGAEYDKYRIHSALRKIEEWYVGDGWYSDGPHFSFDYYNSYVIHPMYVQVLEILVDRKIRLTDKSLAFVEDNYKEAVARIQRFCVILERLVSPEGTFPAFGRSITYRTGVFQPLSMIAWREWLPKELSEGQVRSAMTAVLKRMYEAEGVFSEEGFLQLGFAGHQPEIADWYTNTGSLYIAAEVFLPLGRPAEASFWVTTGEDWTGKKAWSGQNFPRDKAFK
ncbi:MAG: DUF2264 domain-containing protein [Rikenellaceae bacterium]|nr:DUF2264 domain-containing protein [Rikenellaceae bacterium]